ncbi:zinc finger BED domain-containing protein 4-like [Malaya genurostris]|uniref:zinc finger BED domain-containing protein 4-like n=1 Tax=Malaya genurostris TaxID=325434 RepID=UPI0026F3C6B7|nr:zinc finger BED domain-containing protein 4-like [Malaya genurostris]
MAPTQSGVRKFFDVDQKTRKAKCNLCGKQYTYTGGTTNLWKHLSVHHKITQQSTKITSSTLATDFNKTSTDILNPSSDNSDTSKLTSRCTSAVPNTNTFTQPTLDILLAKGKAFKEGGQRAAQLESALLFMICKDNLSLSTPEKEGFNKFCHLLNAFWVPPSRKVVTTRLETIYGILSDTVKTTFAGLQSLCLTMDCWTDSQSTNAFLGVTAHFRIGVEMRSATLGVCHLTQSHTAIYLQQKIQEFLTFWQIELSKVTSVVTDNGANIVLAVKNVFGSSKHIACFDHTLNLIPSKTLSTKLQNGTPNVPGLPELISKVKAIATLSHTSGNFSDEIKRIQREKGLAEGSLLRLIQDVTTRWGSTFAMCDRFLEMQDIISVAALKFPKVVMLSGSEIATLKFIRNLLRPFHQKLAAMESPKDDELADRAKNFIIQEMHKKIDNIEGSTFLAKATLLDPRFKKIDFNMKSVHVYNAVESLKREMTRLPIIAYKYPQLYKIAQVYVPAVATSVPAERLFSLAGRILGDETNRLTPEHFQQRIFLAGLGTEVWETTLNI